MSDNNEDRPIAVAADVVPARAKPSSYPEPFLSRVGKREKRPLGDFFGLQNFGVNLTRLAPGGQSSLLHRHKVQDEMVYILQGEATLKTDRGETVMSEGMCAGFRADGIAHQLVNHTDQDVVYLEIGDRLPGDSGSYPNDDIQASVGPDGKYVFTRKDGTPY